MTPEAQRMAIAEACGWTWQEGPALSWYSADIPRGWKSPKTGRCEILPDYLRDLNAMHDAEGALTHEQLLGFDRMLHIEVCKGSFQKAIHATAVWRAEAFLKAIGKWVD